VFKKVIRRSLFLATSTIEQEHQVNISCFLRRSKSKAPRRIFDSRNEGKKDIGELDDDKIKGRENHNSRTKMELKSRESKYEEGKKAI